MKFVALTLAFTALTQAASVFNPSDPDCIKDNETCLYPGGLMKNCCNPKFKCVKNLVGYGQCIEPVELPTTWSS